MVAQKVRKSKTSWATTSFRKRILPHGSSITKKRNVQNITNTRTHTCTHVCVHMCM